MTNFEVPHLILDPPYEKSVWDHLAVKVFDDRGDELLVVKKLSEASNAQ